LVLLIDPDDSFRRRIEVGIPRWEFQSVSGPSALPAHRHPDVVVVDVCPSGMARPDLVEKVRASLPGVRVIAVTAYPSLDLAVAVTKAGADICLAKPVDPSELERVLVDGSFVPSLSRFSSLPSLARIEWEHIARVLSSVDGNISSAARTLGIQRSTLQRKLKKYPPKW
jgi:two-component system response regulator RegA